MFLCVLLQVIRKIAREPTSDHIGRALCPAVQDEDSLTSIARYVRQRPQEPTDLIFEMEEEHMLLREDLKDIIKYN